MSVIIKGMNVPETCYKCHFSDWRYGAWYRAALQKHLGDVGKGRTSECPLVELPPHGRLIDADEQIERAWRLNLSTRELIEEMLKTAVTVISPDV